MTKPEMTKKGQFFDYSTLILVLVLIAFGLVMVYSTSSYSGAQKYGDAAYFFKKQFKSTLLGLICLFAATMIPYQTWYKFALPMYIASLISVLLVLSPLGMTINGARRWINVGMSIQPAEVVKLCIVIMLATFCCYSGKYMGKAKNNAIYIGLTLVPVAFIFGITSNLSSAIIVLGIAYVLLLVANPKPGWILIVSALAVVAVAIFLMMFFKSANDGTGLGFRFKRLLAWRDPESYASGTGYQTLQALYAIGSGGFFGKGLGQSIQKLGFIPEAQNDMIFSVVCEELGLFGGICLIVLFMLLIYRFMVIANNAPDLFGSLLVVGVMAHIAIQVILNIAVVTNSIPNTGVTLPFISYGGTSVAFLLIEMGIVLNVSKQIRVPVTTPKRKKEFE